MLHAYPISIKNNHKEKKKKDKVQSAQIEFIGCPQSLHYTNYDAQQNRTVNLVLLSVA